jgi:hypothetical protein
MRVPPQLLNLGVQFRCVDFSSGVSMNLAVAVPAVVCSVFCDVVGGGVLGG